MWQTLAMPRCSGMQPAFMPDLMIARMTPACGRMMSLVPAHVQKTTFLDDR
jgi:hypothetical protein